MHPFYDIILQLYLLALKEIYFYTYSNVEKLGFVVFIHLFIFLARNGIRQKITISVHIDHTLHILRYIKHSKKKMPIHSYKARLYRTRMFFLEWDNDSIDIIFSHKIAHF